MDTRSLAVAGPSSRPVNIDSGRRPFAGASSVVNSKPGRGPITRSIASSPLALFSTSPAGLLTSGPLKANLAGRRRSVVEPILEFEEDQEPFKARQHHLKPRSLPLRSKSVPSDLFLSTTTTKPIYINHPPRYFTSSLHSAGDRLIRSFNVSARCRGTRSCRAASRSTLALEAAVTSTSKPLPLASQPRLCAMI